MDTHTLARPHCYTSTGDWNMREPGVTAIAHPAPLDLCTNHGVFVFKDVNEVCDKYNKGTLIVRVMDISSLIMLQAALC